MIRLYGKNLSKNKRAIKKEIELIRECLDKISDISSCVNVNDFLVFKKDIFDKTSPILDHSLAEINSKLDQLRTFCYEDIETIINQLGLKITDENITLFKSLQSCKELIDTSISDEKERTQLKNRILTNQIIRTFIHQSKINLQNVIPISLSMSLKNEEKIKRNLKKENYYVNKTKIYKDQIKRFENEFNSILSIYKDKNNFKITTFSSKEIADYVEVFADRALAFFYNLEEHIVSIEISKFSEVILSTDKYKIEEVLDVVLNNACEELALTPPNNSKNKKTIEVEINSTEDKLLEIIITDNGRGIQDTTQIFNIDYTTKKSLGGSGVGLAAAKSIAKTLEGNISAYSKPNEGAKFIFTIPMFIEGQYDI